MGIQLNTLELEWARPCSPTQQLWLEERYFAFEYMDPLALVVTRTGKGNTLLGGVTTR